MRYSILVLIIFSLISQLAFSQLNINPEMFKTFTFQCFSRTDSIKLPNDLRGPKYFNYEEGSIVSFVSSDSIMIRILCGADALLTLDSLYLGVDSIKDNGRLISIRYINKIKNRYARQDYNIDYGILYQDVPYQRKDEFDSAFDRLRNNQQKKK